MVDSKRKSDALNLGEFTQDELRRLYPSLAWVLGLPGSHGPDMPPLAACGRDVVAERVNDSAGTDVPREEGE